MIQAFDCPRCRRSTDQRFYGPCSACRDELRATVAGEAHAREVDEFVPKMNVTPNAVASKD
jgi:NMD protein affecting ribosome stability and mRNA decay